MRRQTSDEWIGCEEGGDGNRWQAKNKHLGLRKMEKKRGNVLQKKANYQIRISLKCNNELKNKMHN